MLGRVNGAWWPYSRDLAVEGADLVDHFPARFGRVSRLWFSRPDWTAPVGEESLHHLQASGRVVKTGSFPGDDTHVVEVTLRSRERLTMLVVPPETHPALAERLLAAAADDDNPHTPIEILSAAVPAGVSTAPPTWDDDGGA